MFTGLGFAADRSIRSFIEGTGFGFTLLGLRKIIL